jgi:hypothetical protein
MLRQKRIRVAGRGPTPRRKGPPELTADRRACQVSDGLCVQYLMDLIRTRAGRGISTLGRHRGDETPLRQARSRIQAEGNVKEKVLPSPTWLSAQILPWWASTSRLEM